MVNHNEEITTVSLFKFDKLSAKYWAFTGMQLSHRLFKNIPGLSFYKLLGTGGENGFKWYPNFEVYSILCVWENEDFAKSFMNKSTAFEAYERRSVEHKTFFLKSIKSQGEWSAQKPFHDNKVDLKDDDTMAVLTRATIRTRHLPAFWKKVKSVSDAINNFEDCLFSIGVGEWPVFQQATFSIWQNFNSMKSYAYEHPLHKEVIALTRKNDWYKEELFARFKVLKSEGSWIVEN